MSGARTWARRLGCLLGLPLLIVVLGFVGFLLLIGYLFSGCDESVT
jgi:hypothetical protein